MVFNYIIIFSYIYGMKKRVNCEDSSPIYKEIMNSKHNRKQIENGIRIGNNMYLCSKTSIIQKL